MMSTRYSATISANTGAEPVRLSQEGEAAWQQLRRHVEWAQGFALIFLFASDPGIIAVFRERLKVSQRLRVSGLEVLHPGDPAVLVEQVMEGVRHPSEEYQDLNAPWWVEINRSDEEGAWDSARRALLARLNEHREVVRRTLNRPLILVLPLGFGQVTRETAPDLWSIRDLSLFLSPAELVELPSADVRQAAEVTDRGPLAAVRADVSEHPLVKEWQRLLPKTPDIPDERLRDVLLAGWRAFDTAFEAGDLERAEAIASGAVELARRKVAEEMPEALRDVSVSLDRVGDVARQRGDLEAAEEAYRESLALRRAILERVGEVPEALRDVSVSLDRVGGVARQRGDLEAAEEAYREALRLASRLAHVFPEVTDYENLRSWLLAALASISDQLSDGVSEDR